MIYSEKAELFIGNMDEEEISWTTFLNPFSVRLWITLIGMAFVISSTITCIESIYSPKETYAWFFLNYLGNLWFALKANIGGKPSTVQPNYAHRIVLFYCLLAGSIVWMAYRASLTGELSIIKQNLPFNDMESLLKSDYK